MIGFDDFFVDGLEEGDGLRLGFLGDMSSVTVRGCQVMFYACAEQDEVSPGCGIVGIFTRAPTSRVVLLCRVSVVGVVF